MTTPTPGSPDWLRPLPGTDLTVSAVCLGGSPIASIPRLYDHEVSDDEGVATVRAVLDSPIRFIDTSNNYGDGLSEERIGAALAAAGGRPEGVVVATKVDALGRDFSGDRVRASFDESRARLGMDVLPLVHLHDPEYFDFDEITRPGGAVDALVALKESGRVGAIGIAAGQVQEIIRYVELDVFDVLLTHNRWTLVDRSATALFEAARARGMGILNAAVYGGGILAGRDNGRYGYRPAPPEVLDAVARMRQVCAAHGTDLATAALQHSLRDPRFASTVVGMGRPDRVAETLAAVSAPLPGALWPELEALLPPEHAWIDAPFD